jgi:hypothetical protein
MVLNRFPWCLMDTVCFAIAGLFSIVPLEQAILPLGV